MANKLHMIRPCGGLAGAHLQYVSDHGVDSAGGVAPYVVEYAQGTNVQHSLNWKLSEEEVQGRYWRALTEFQETPQSFLLICL